MENKNDFFPQILLLLNKLGGGSPVKDWKTRVTNYQDKQLAL
jgi:hypothetical protein